MEEMKRSFNTSKGLHPCSLPGKIITAIIDGPMLIVLIFCVHIAGIESDRFLL